MIKDNVINLYQLMIEGILYRLTSVGRKIRVKLAGKKCYPLIIADSMKSFETVPFHDWRYITDS